MKKYLMLILGCLLCAISFNLFFVPYHIIPGGISGISIIISNYFALNKGLFILIGSIILLIISLFILGKKTISESLIGSILYPVFIILIELLLNKYPIKIDNILLSAIFGGISCGFGMGIVFKYGFTTGGTNLLNEIVSKYFKISIGTAILITEGIQLLIMPFVYGINIFLYSIVAIYLISYITDNVFLGLSSKKSFYIVSSKKEEVCSYILNDLNHGVTILKGKGAYTKEEKDVLLTVIPNNDYYYLKEGIKKIDPDAFFIACDSYQAQGGE